MNSHTNISIVICCYNAASRIKPTLEHLAGQELGGLAAEVILVDNNCTDDTVALAQKVWIDNKQPFELHIIQELQAGLSFARRAGVTAAKGELLIFCDDDNWLDKDFCSIAYKIMKDKPEVGVLGGRGIAKTDGEFPFWFTTYQSSYAVGVQSMFSSYVGNRKHVWGAGMVTRTAEINRIYQSGFISLLTDRKGVELSSGGDSEICRWYLLTGKKIYYSEELVFGHFIEQNRLDREYLKRLHGAFAQTEKPLNVYDLYATLTLNYSKVGWYTFIKLMIKFYRGRTTNYDNMLLEIFNKTNIVFHKEALGIKQALKNYKQNS
jgi:glycosyltransferase involved in cell wall biosynthesis